MAAQTPSFFLSFIEPIFIDDFSDFSNWFVPRTKGGPRPDGSPCSFRGLANFALYPLNF